MSALTPYGQTLAVSQAAKTPQVHQAFNVHRNFAPKVPFNFVVLFDDLSDLSSLLFGQILRTRFKANPGLFTNPVSDVGSNTVDILKSNYRSLLNWEIYTGNSGHFFLSSDIYLTERRIILAAVCGEGFQHK
jgi:hypothetical protein